MMVPGLELVARSLLDIKHKLEGNNMDGFITNKEWNRIINTKVRVTHCIMSCDASCDPLLALVSVIM